MIFSHKERLPNPQLRLNQHHGTGIFRGPPEAQLLLASYFKATNETGRAYIGFILNGIIPKSLNSQYRRLGRRKGQRYGFDDDIKMLRDLTRYQISQSPKIFKPKGLLAAVVFLETPQWVTQERKPRQLDADNKVKPLMDAIEKATGIGDERYWAIHVFKVTSKRTATIVHLFDLGDVVDSYG